MHMLLLLLVYGSMLFAQAPVAALLTPDSYKHPVEPSIAINPTDPDNIITAFIRYGDIEAGETRVVNMRYHTRDGGKTWKMVPEMNPDRRVQGDDVMAFNANGIAYHCFIAFRGLRTNQRKASGIWVTYSGKDTDQWHGPVKVVDHYNTLRPHEDKPWLSTDNAPNSPYKNNVYLAWTRFDAYQDALPGDSSQIVFSYSNDGGKSYVSPFRISDSGGDCQDDDYTVEGAVPAVGPNGEVYISWSGPRGLIFDKSLDGGKTFGKDRVLTELVGGWNMDIAGIFRCNGFPVTRVDVSEGSHRGNIYINWVDQRNGDPDVFLMVSSDGGDTWSRHIRVNNDPLFNGKAQFFTWMSVDPIDGSVNIIYYDRRNANDTTTELYLSRSVDGGQHFTHFKMDHVKPFQCVKDIFFGDYTNIDAYNGRIAAVFSTFVNQTNTGIRTAIYDFVPGTVKRLER